MKKLFISLSLLAIALVATADDPESEARATKYLLSMFKNATNISWRENGQLLHAIFLDGDKGYKSAFFNEDIELVAVGRNISLNELTMDVRASLLDVVKEEDIVSVHEFVTGSKIWYQVYANENKPEFTELQVTPDGEIKIVLKTKPSVKKKKN